MSKDFDKLDGKRNPLSLRNLIFLTSEV